MVKTAVILHGWGSRLSRWQPLVKQLLSSGLKVVLPHLPEDKARNTADFADWFDQKTKILAPFFLIGHSFGGQVAINFAARYPKRVKKLILISSAGIRRPNLKSRLLKGPAKLLKGLAGQRLKQLLYRLIGATDYIQASPVMKATFKIIVREDQQQNLKQILAPVLLLWGKHDRYTPLGQGRLMQALLPKGQLIIFPDGKHGLPFTHVTQLKEKILWFIGSK